MNLTYFRFLFINILKKWTIWILGILYVFIILLLLLIVPKIINSNPWILWGDTDIGIQAIIMYVGALFSAILAIAIFKDYRDNGAELIVVSKPISRYKIILTKFLVYMFVSLIFVLFLALISLSTFSFGSVSGKDVGSLVFSIIISNLVFIIAFGFLSTIVSIFFSKVWTILANILVVIVLNIYSTITVIVVKSPGDIANNEGSVIITSQYLSKNGEVKSMGALTPQFKQDEHGFSLDASFDNEVEQWNRYVNSSSANLATKFDFIHQFALMSNMLTLQEKMNDKASNYFGSSRFFNYKINKSITNLEREDQPLYYVKLPILTQSSAVFDSNDVNKIMIAISTGDIATLNSYLERAMNFFMTMLTDESVVYIGNSNTSIISSLFSVNKTTNNDQLVIASGIDGNTGSRNNRIYYSKDMLQTNEQEEKIFKKIICDLDNEDNYDKFVGSSTSTTSPNIIVANNVYGGKNYSGGSSNDLPMRLVGFNNDVDGWSLSNTLSAFSNLIDVPTLTNRGMLRNFWDLIHIILVSHKQELGIIDQKTLMDEYIKFKYYAFVSLCTKLSSQNKDSDFSNTYNAPLDLPINLDINLDSFCQENISGNYKLNIDHSLLLPFSIKDGSYGKDLLNITINQNLYSEHPEQFIENVLKILSLSIPYPYTNLIPGWDTNAEQKTNPFFSSKSALIDRVLLDWAVDNDNYGYINADDPFITTRDKKYVANLNTVSSSGGGSNNISTLNYPIIFNNLDSSFSATPVDQFWTYAIIWTCIMLVIGSIAASLYLRLDFK